MLLSFDSLKSIFDKNLFNTESKIEDIDCKITFFQFFKNYFLPAVSATAATITTPVVKSL